MIREEVPAPLRAVSRAYRGDFETIVAKALENDKSSGMRRLWTWRRTFGIT
jgi:hypothetical protein